MLAGFALLLLCAVHYQAATSTDELRVDELRVDKLRADELRVAEKRQVATGSSTADQDRSFQDGPSGPGHVGHVDSVGDECVGDCDHTQAHHVASDAFLVHDGAGHADQFSHSLAGDGSTASGGSTFGGGSTADTGSHTTACELERTANMPAIGFYTQECNENKPCPSGQFCQFPPGKCMDKLLANMRCTMKGQCKSGLTCQYGRCRTGTKGDRKAGSFCLNHSECNKASQCCNLVRSISECVKTCVPKLSRGQQCGGFGSPGCGHPGSSGFGFHGHEDDSSHLLTNADESCTPCSGSDVCKEQGLIASYMICAPP